MRDFYAVLDQVLALLRSGLARAGGILLAAGRRTRQRPLGQYGSYQPLHFYDWFTEGFETADLQDAKVLLEVLSHERT